MNYTLASLPSDTGKLLSDKGRSSNMWERHVEKILEKSLYKQQINFSGFHVCVVRF